MRRHPNSLLASCVALLATLACAGEAPPGGNGGATDTRGFVSVGEPAPDFELRGATRYGVLAEPVRLSDFRGKTVVLAFFFRARGSG